MSDLESLLRKDTFDRFAECPECHAYDWTLRHKCKPVHHVRLLKAGEEWFKVHATDAHEAAERGAARVDERYDDYTIAQRGQVVEIEVADFPNPEPGEVKRFRVEGSMEPCYSACEIRGKAKGKR